MPEPDKPCVCALDTLLGLGLDLEQAETVVHFGLNMFRVGQAWEQVRGSLGADESPQPDMLIDVLQMALGMALAMKALPTSPEVAAAMRGDHG